MTKIRIEKMREEKLKKLKVSTWPVWECEPSSFDWEYDSNESCYILEGEARVETPEGSVSFGKGDFVVFPKGMKCRWKVLQKIKKHYKFD